MSVSALKSITPRAEQTVNKTLVFHLTREMDEELRHYLLGQVLKRVREFDEKHNPQGRPEVHSREVERDFASDNNHQFFIAVGVKDSLVVGHLLARQFDYYGKRYIHVEQMVIGRHSGITLGQKLGIFGMIKAWQKAVGAEEMITTAALNEAHVRRLRRFYGFKPMFILAGT